MLEENQQKIKTFFIDCKSPEARYKKLISFGEAAPPFPLEEKMDENLVPGCQSLLYLAAKHKDGKLFFLVWSDALISKGLAALGATYFSGLTPEEILNAPTSLFQEIGITSSLSPSRINGFANLILKIKQKAVSFIN